MSGLQEGGVPVAAVRGGAPRGDTAQGGGPRSPALRADAHLPVQLVPAVPPDVQPPEVEKMMNEPKTTAEKLDAARNGDEFAAAIQGLFAALETAMDKEAEQ